MFEPSFNERWHGSYKRQMDTITGKCSVFCSGRWDPSDDLKGKEIKRAIVDDWSEDLDLPGDIPLKFAKHDGRDLSESLRQMSATFRTLSRTLDMKIL